MLSNAVLKPVAAFAAVLVVGVSLVCPAALADSPPITPPPVTVTPSPGAGGVGIGVSAPGGDHSGSDGGPIGSGGTADPCTYRLAVPPPTEGPVAVSLKAGGGSVYWVDCPGGSGGYEWFPPGKTAPPPPRAIDLARQAYGQLPLPAPVPSRYPTGTLADGRPYTIVQTHMWFSTSGGSWGALSKKVCAGSLCATATAKPTTLTFGPGDGDGSVSCPGPGTTFRKPANGSWVPGRQPQGCDYQYTKSSYGDPNGEVTSTYTIGWTVTWTATNGQGGNFEDLQSAATSRFAVAELQSVVTR